MTIDVAEFVNVVANAITAAAVAYASRQLKLLLADLRRTRQAVEREEVRQHDVT